VDNIIYVDFTSKQMFNADVYSFDMKKYRFQTIATSLNEAYYAFVDAAQLHDIDVIRCIAIYLGLPEHRSSCQLPAKVWQQYDPVTGLVEY